jgi:SPP1 family predicted phage head-tail adaptor
MAYQSGFLHNRVTIWNKVVSTGFGDITSWQDVGTVWANVTFSRGMKSLREGALDAYDTVIIRMRYNKIVTRDSLLVHDGRTYQIQSFHRDMRENIVQITAVEMVQPPTLLPDNILMDANGVALTDADGVYLTADYN